MSFNFSKIQSVYIEVPNFKYEHGTNPAEQSGESKDKKPFVGRDNLVGKIASLLTAKGGGAYLITGFRGVGKTTLVKEAVKQVRDQRDYD
jgi:predicted AAA+ superfamily ATPase